MTGWVAVATILVQGTAPTVGDTVWLSRDVALPPGHVVRAADWDPADPVELLGRPKVIISGDSARISYPVVIWRPGAQRIELPGPLLLGPGGTVDSLAAHIVPVTVRSVLPRVPPDSLLPPQPRASLVSRRTVSVIPVAMLWLVALAILIPLHLWWRRRGPPMPPVRVATDLADPPLDRWADAGEHRAVANVAAVRLRSAVARQVTGAHAGLDTERLLAELAAVRPHWPLAELATILRKLDDARFGLSGSPDALQLSRSTLELRDRLLRDAA